MFDQSEKKLKPYFSRAYFRDKFLIKTYKFQLSAAEMRLSLNRSDTREDMVT